MKQGYTHITLVLDSSGSMSSIKKDTIGGYNDFIKKQKELPGECSFKHIEFSSANPKHNKNYRATKHLVTYLTVPAVPSYPLDAKVSQQITIGGVAQSNVIPLGYGCVPNQPNWSPPINIPSVWTNPYGRPQNNQYAEVESVKDIKNAALLNDETYAPGGGTPLLDSIGRAVYETGEFLMALPESQRPDRVLIVILTDGEENQSGEYTKDDIAAIVKHQQSKYDWDFIFLGANMDAIQVGTSYGFNSGMSVNFAASAAGMSGTTATLSEKVATYRMSSSVADAKAFLNYSDIDRARSMGEVVVDSNTTNQVSLTA